MLLDKANKIAYLEFPAKKEEVSKALADGYEIIDIKFKPAAQEGTSETKVESDNVPKQSEGFKQPKVGA